MTMAGGLYGKTLEKFFIDTVGKSLESETDIKTMLVQDAHTPNFDTHDFRDDVTNEPAASGTYSAGGVVLVTTELTVAAPAATQIKYDADDPAAFTAATLTAKGHVTYVGRGGASSADELVCANIFATDVISTAGSWALQLPANGLFYIDYA